MNRLGRFYKEWGFFIFLLLLMSVFRSAVADWFTVPTGSMKPTIIEGDRIYVNKMAYGLRVPFTTLSLVRWSQPVPGDVVVFESLAADKRLIKRVIGVAGDEVQMIENQLFINGQPVAYMPSLLEARSINWGDASQPVLMREQIPGKPHEVALTYSNSSFGPVTVPKDHLFVLGDNRDHSADSRYIGFVPMDELLGKALNVIVSLDSEHYYIPREGRYLKSLDSDS